MTAVRSYALVASAFVALIAIGASRWQAAVPAIRYQNVATGSTTRSETDSLEAMLAEAEDFVITNDPFRLANEPTSVRYNPANENGGAAGVAVPPPLRPSMTLKAIVGGPPWQAIVDGIPGQPAGTIVRSGSAFDKLLARAVTRDSVIIQGPDTTWVLSFRRRP
jgi:hypothetical protein